MNRFPIAFGILTLLILTSSVWSRAAVASAARKPASAKAELAPLHVDKNQVLNSRNERVHLRGVNAASLEWTSNGQGHILDTVRTAIDDWHANVIRLPLAQDRWFGKAAEQKGDAKPYQALVKQVVDLCASKGCYIVLDLHWSDWKYTPTPSFGKWVKLALAGNLPPYVPPPAKPNSPPPTMVPAPQSPLGIFESHADVGVVLHPGTFAFDPTAKTYTVTASGENMWSTKDAFHFVWKKMSGDLAVTADIKFEGEAAEPHRKACLMIRQGLDADAAYVDAALHGDGLTSLQFRETKGAATHEVQANVSAPARLRLVKRGHYALLYLAGKDEEFRYSGAAVRLSISDEPLNVGIGVCAHNKDAVARVIFSNVQVETIASGGPRPTKLYSSLEMQAMSSTDRHVVYVTPGRIEAPNWMHDGKSLIFNSGGRILQIPVTGGKPTPIDTGFATRCNNDHGISPDGNSLAISDQSQGKRQSLIYTLPITGGMPKLITPIGPSYWHGWSPNGKTLAFCGERNGEFDIYTVPAEGGPETRLTTAKGLDDGPEYSPDGKSIYFNSERTGRMQIWRMNADGSEQEQVTNDDFNNWFPHLSPNGRTMVFLSFEKAVVGHPANKDVTLRSMNLGTKKIDVLGKFFGGQGTINVPCWSPDGRRIAFVTYQLVP